MEATENDDSFTHAPAIKRRNPEVIGIENPQKTSHADPPKDTHGCAWPTLATWDSAR